MARIFYVHWNEKEALEEVSRLRAAGHVVRHHSDTGEGAWRLLREEPPDVLVVSLARLPSHGRQLAAATLDSRKLRDLPLVFVDGEADKVDTARGQFPEAVFCTSDELIKVLSKPPSPRALRPAKTPAGYSGKPLVTKLGIKPNQRLAILHAPPGFGDVLGELPEGVEAKTSAATGRFELIHLFCTSSDELVRQFDKLYRRIEPDGALWVSWPKKTSGVKTDLTEDVIRALAIEAGLIDVKVCAVDDTWSALKLVIPLKHRPKKPGRR